MNMRLSCFELLSFMLACCLLMLWAGCKEAYKTNKVGIRQDHFSGSFDESYLDTSGGRAVLEFVRRLEGRGDTAVLRSAYPANELLAKLDSPASRGQLQSFLMESKSRNGLRMEVVDSLPESRLYLIRIDTAGIVSSKAFGGQLMASGLFSYVEPNYLLRTQSNQLLYEIDPGQWGLLNRGREYSQWHGKYDADIDGVEAISRLLYGEHPLRTVTVAVIDGGIDILHEAFSNSLWKNPGEVPDNFKDDDGNGYIDDVYGWNFASNNHHFFDKRGHGNHVSGIIAAGHTRGGKMTGVAINARILTCKTTEDTSHAVLDLLKALKYALEMKADMINMSLGSYDTSRAFGEGVAEVINAGIPVIAAAGNDGLDITRFPVYPAGYPKVISVANSNKNDELSATSNYSGGDCRIAAPGEGILSCLPGDRYGWMSGTSMAAPHVTGTVALLKGLDSTLDILTIIRRLSDGADILPHLQFKVIDGQRLNVYRTLFHGREEFDADGVAYQWQVVNGRFRNSLQPYANAHEPGIDGKSYRTAYRISHMKQLMNIRDEDLEAHFRLTNNLDWHSLHPNDRQMIARTFNGTLHGDGFTIRNFDLQTAYPTGLFRRLGPKAVIKDLQFSGVNLKGGSQVGVLAAEMQGSYIDDVQVEGIVRGESSVGGLFGSSSGGRILNSYFEGQIICLKPDGKGQNSGGICGSATGTNLLRCHVQADITAQDYGGGLAGRFSGVIDECYAFCRIRGNKNIGGLAGFLSKGSIMNAYAEGRVQGQESAGGLVGLIMECLLVRSYSLCEVENNKYCGGLIGKGHSFALKQCYYVDANPEGGGGRARSHVELQDERSFEGWFPSTVWTIKSRHTPALGSLPRSVGSQYFTGGGDRDKGERIRLAAVRSQAGRDTVRIAVPERTIWRWGDLYLPTSGVTLGDVQLVLNANDVLTLSVRLQSHQRYSKNGYHPRFGIKLYDRSGALVADWKAFPSIPLTCDLNQVFTKTATFPGAYARVFKGALDFPSIPYNYCNR